MLWPFRKRGKKPWTLAGEVWVPGKISLPNQGKALEICYLHASLSRHHKGLLTIVAEGNQVFRRYVHTECDLVFAEPLELAPGAEVWMGTGPTPEPIDPETLSCTFTVIGRTR